MNLKHYATALTLLALAYTQTFALTLYTMQNGIWGPGGTTGLFNTASDGSGTSYDGSSTLWQGAANELIIQSGHVIEFKHNSFTLGNLTVGVNAKLYSNDITNASNYILDIRGTSLTVKGEIGNGIPANPEDADRIGIHTEGGTFSGAGTITVRELVWNYNNALIINCILNIHKYDTTWENWYPYPGFGSGTAADLTINTDYELNIYGNLAPDYDLRFTPAVATNASDILGKFSVDGTLAVYGGNCLMKTDNSNNQDFFIIINSDGKLYAENTIICNRGIGDPAPYLGLGQIVIAVSGELESAATDPIQYSSIASSINIRAGSKFKLSGAANQILDEDVDGATYSTVELGGIGPKMLNANIKIDNQLIFTDCGMQLGNFNLTMTKTFAASTTSDVFQNYSDTKFIETNGTGSLKVFVGEGSFFNPFRITIPVGNGTYNETTWENYPAVSDFLSVKVSNQVLSDGSTGTPVTSLVVQKTWDIKEDTPGGQNMNATFKWAPADESPDFNRNDTWVSHHDGVNWDTDIQGTGGATADGAYYTRTRNGITDFSPYAIYSSAALLPVELVDFSGKLKEDMVILDWQTASEKDNKQFIVEHSPDGRDFKAIGVVAGAGTTNLAQAYNFNHYNPINGFNYYRLKQEDYSGDTNYSPIVVVAIKKRQTTLNVFPTLANDHVNCNFEDWTGPAQIEIVNITGKSMLLLDLEWYGSDQSIDISTLSPGKYWLNLKTGAGEAHTVQFIKI